jgi:hypothetical protein
MNQTKTRTHTPLTYSANSLNASSESFDLLLHSPSMWSPHRIEPFSHHAKLEFEFDSNRITRIVVGQIPTGWQFAHSRFTCESTMEDAIHMKEFLEALEKYTPTIPEEVVSFYLHQSGVDTKQDPRMYVAFSAS